MENPQAVRGRTRTPNTIDSKALSALSAGMIKGCAAWWDFSTLKLGNGDPITRVPDLSGNYHDLIQTNAAF